MSKPGKQFVIRRYAFAAVQQAFAENGIEFATPKVEVSMDGDEREDERPSTSSAGAAAKHVLKPPVPAVE
jgi:small-conductance mechanosensitive channel